MIMLGNVFNRSFNILKRKPIVLWSTSIACSVITIVIQSMFAFAPFISIPAVLTLSAGMAALYLEGYNGVEITAEQLFRGFSRKHKCFPRVTLGMLWHSLWTIIWMFVPVAGVVKVYQYSFTPYILLSRPEVSPVDALILSKKETKGYKLLMFAADVIITFSFVLLLALFIAAAIIPVLGWIVCAVGIVLLVIITPLLRGLVMAGFYQEAQNAASQQRYYPHNYVGYPNPAGEYVNQQYQTPENEGNPIQTAEPTETLVQTEVQSAPTEQPVEVKEPKKWFCTQCGTQNERDAMFCKQCGNKKIIRT